MVKLRKFSNFLNKFQSINNSILWPTKWNCLCAHFLGYSCLLTSSPDGSYPVVVRLQPPERWQAGERPRGEAEELVVGHVQVLKAGQALEGVVVDLKKQNRGRFLNVECVGIRVLLRNSSSN